jgi:hypothetical protein
MFAALAIGHRWLRITRSRSPIRRRDVARLVVILGLVVGHLLWRCFYYGSLLPNPLVAKAMGIQLRPVLEGCVYLYRDVIAAGGFLFLALPAIALWLSGRCSTMGGFCALTLAVYALFVIVAGGDWMPMQRFLVHVLPLLCLLIQEGFARVGELFGRRRDLVIGLLLAGQIGILLAASAEQRFVFGTGVGRLVPDGGMTGAFLRENVRRSDTIALVDAGVYGFLVPLEVRVVDMIGLTDRHIASTSARFPGGLLGRGDGFGKWDVEYVLAQEPDYVQVHARGRAADGTWRTDFTGTTLLVNDPRFGASYEPVPEGGTGMFVRIQSSGR